MGYRSALTLQIHLLPGFLLFTFSSPSIWCGFGVCVLFLVAIFPINYPILLTSKLAMVWKCVWNNCREPTLLFDDDVMSRLRLLKPWKEWISLKIRLFINTALFFTLFRVRTRNIAQISGQLISILILIY